MSSFATRECAAYRAASPRTLERYCLIALVATSLFACNRATDKAFVRCGHCGSSLSPAAKSCPKCGEPTAVADVVVNSIGMRLKPIGSGRFRMGATDHDTAAGAEEKPAHTVVISMPFLVGVTEVTQSQYQAVMEYNPSAFSPDGTKGDEVRGLQTSEFPVESVTWHEAVEFCDRLSDLPEERAKGRKYRLPTEAEWEFAATRERGAGSQSDRGSSPSSGRRRPYAVEKGVANGSGLVGMMDNVAEWASDWFSSDYYTTSTGRDRKGVKDGVVRSFRGAAWNSSPASRRITVRDADVPEARREDLGFRVLCTEVDAGAIAHNELENSRSEIVLRPTPPPPTGAADISASLTAWKRAVVRLAVRAADGEGQGSGFVIDNKGTIVTNAHVIDDAIEVTAFFSDGFQERIQGIVGISADKDLAFLRLASGESRCEPLVLAGSLPPDGRTVYALGCPLGLGFSLTQGIVSGVRSAAELREAFRSEGSRGPDLSVQWIQTTAAVNWGNSGGPLIDDKGQVVGVNTLVFGRDREGGTAEGLNFAVSSHDVLQAHRSLIDRVRPFPQR
jgi:formylglycine-generating enzyme required for sulfatase activity